MTPSRVQAKVVTSRVSWIRQMLDGIRALPLQSYAEFSSDPRNSAAADSYLRRALEALLDLGRHLAAKAFGEAVTEYKEIAGAMQRSGVLNEDLGSLLARLAGYRNRLVHFYNQVSQEELYSICSNRLADIESVLNATLDWLKAHPEKLDDGL